MTSRKRKLRQLYAVCIDQEPLPTLSYDSIDAPPTNVEEQRFLDASDILKYVIILLIVASLAAPGPC